MLAGSATFPLWGKMELPTRDFQFEYQAPKAIFIRELPGRPLPRLRDCAHPRITHTRKNPAIVVENLTAWVAAPNLHEICRFLNLIERRE
jgi:hypothetical protein